MRFDASAQVGIVSRARPRSLATPDMLTAKLSTSTSSPKPRSAMYSTGHVLQKRRHSGTWHFEQFAGQELQAEASRADWWGRVLHTYEHTSQRLQTRTGKWPRPDCCLARKRSCKSDTAACRHRCPRQAKPTHRMARCTTATERSVRDAAKRRPKPALPSTGTPSQKE